MTEIVGVRFKKVGKIYYFSPQGLNIKYGERVIVETIRGIEIGTVVIPNREVEENEKFMPLSNVLRIATEEDRLVDEENTKKEVDAFIKCKEKIQEHGLEMTLLDVEYTFDNSKVIFSFVADGRIDFRELVKDLAAIFKTRIELRQIGVRDETKHVGGLGICGRKVCCAQFLSEFCPVSVKMAKDQTLSTNPQKISGACGKLICCLNYEQSTYEEAFQHMPKVDYLVSTPDGEGTVVETNVIGEYVRVKLNTEENLIKKYNAKDVKTIKATEQQDNNGGNSADEPETE